MNRGLSSEMLHATSVAKGGRAVLMTGRSGSGKSDLALRLFDRGFVLVSDDQTMLSKADHRLIASAPPAILGKLEVRGIGIVDVTPTYHVPVCLIVELAGAVERMPDGSSERVILGITVPLVTIDALTASASAKVELALDRLGLEA